MYEGEEQGNAFQDQLTSLQGHGSTLETLNPLSQGSDHSINNLRFFEASATIEDLLTLSRGTGMLPNDQWQGLNSTQDFDVEGP